MMKKLLTAALSIVMLMGCMTTFASAGWVTQDGKLVYADDSEAPAVTQPVTTPTETPAETTTPAQHKVTFSDVNPDDWFYEAVMTMADTGLVNGVSEGVFKPNDNITWAQWATLLWRISLEDEKPIAGMIKGAHWGSTVMANLNGHLVACPDPVFSVVSVEDRAVKRAEAAAYLRNFFYKKPALSKVVNDITEADIPDWDQVLALGAGSRFNDGYEVNGVWISTSPECILETIRAGIMNGVDENNTFAPNGTLTRAQFCQMLYNAGVRGTMYDLYKLNSIR